MDAKTINELAMSMIEDTVEKGYQYHDGKDLLLALAEISGILRLARALKEAGKDA